MESLTSEELAVIGLAINALALTVLTVTLIVTFLQFRRAHEWNRRQASFDLSMQIVTGELLDLRLRLKREYGVDPIRTERTPFAAVRAALDEDSENRFLTDVGAIFNSLETVAIGIKNGILDEDICYEHASFLLVWLCDWAQDYLDEVQAIDPTLLIECEHYAKKWDDRSRQEKQALRSPGKGPL